MASLVALSGGCRNSLDRNKLSLESDKRSPVRKAKSEFIGSLRECLADEELSTDERREAAAILTRLGDASGPRYLLKNAIAAGEDRDFETFLYLKELINAGFPNEFLGRLLESDDADLRLAGAIIAASKLGERPTASLRSLMLDTGDPRIATYAALALGQNGATSDVVLLYRAANDREITDDLRRAARGALGRFYGRDEMTPAAFREETTKLLKAIGDAR